MHLAQHGCFAFKTDLKYSSIPPNHQALAPMCILLCSHPDMLQVFAVDRVKDAVGSHQLHSTLDVDVNYSSTLTVLKTQKGKRVCYLGKVLHTDVCVLCRRRKCRDK